MYRLSSLVSHVLTNFVKMGLKHQQQRLGLNVDSQENASLDAKNLELQKEVSALKERVVILEKIVTADKYDLKKEFDNLGAS